MESSPSAQDTLGSTAQDVSQECRNNPTVRRPDTGCTVQLGAGLVPIRFTHTEKCKCIPVELDEELERLVISVENALEMHILEAEKPSTAFAMLLLGANVVY
ncbi:hypothetical protein F5B19DRAFT_488906 [Rostrohypoxylon terebratum]|nr:hypothetical protein F5B19DRAFT_488906 [Rostrohypoxylon terebratum]